VDPVVIENPILNFPFVEPVRHFNHGKFGRWAFVEMADRRNAKRTIRGSLLEQKLQEKTG
jgi:hypothetical protein